MNEKELIKLYKKAHNYMRDIDGLQPQEAFDELIKFLFLKIQNEINQIDFINEENIFSISQLYLKKYLQPIIKNNNWFVDEFKISEKAFEKIYILFQKINLSKLEKDMKSSALRNFLTPEIRKGLGIFLTPDDVVKAIVEISKPKYGEKILDLTCGSGTFLIESVNYIIKNENPTLPISVYGTDKSPRMYLLAELNLISEDINFNGKVQDSLVIDNEIIVENTYDVILTNPPFGIRVENDVYDFNSFATCKNEDGTLKKVQSSEIVFLEQCLKYLKKGGRLAIVLPKSVINNITMSFQRKEINKLGYVEKIMNLPSETFQITGTQTNTVVLFMKKYLDNEDVNRTIDITHININNVGYDSTGRNIEGSQLSNICLSIQKNENFIEVYKNINKNESLELINSIISKKNNDLNEIKLKDVTETINTGATPARKDYSEEGYFLVKVGNLTGNGIYWKARDRNFIDEVAIEKRKKSKSKLILKINDILLTSSAHNPKYIGEKVDMIYKIPDYIKENISFTGEVMLIRPDLNKINPYLLFAYLKTEKAKKFMRDSIRGQTAHLNANDMLELPIPHYVFEENEQNEILTSILKEELELSFKMNIINYKKEMLLQKY